MDCPDCVAKNEKAAQKVPGVEHIRVSNTSQVMTLHLGDGSAPLPEVEQAVTGLGYRLARLAAPTAGTDDDELSAGLAHFT